MSEAGGGVVPLFSDLRTLEPPLSVELGADHGSDSGVCLCVKNRGPVLLTTLHVVHVHRSPDQNTSVLGSGPV